MEKDEAVESASSDSDRGELRCRSSEFAVANAVKTPGYLQNGSEQNRIIDPYEFDKLLALWHRNGEVLVGVRWCGWSPMCDTL